MSSRSFQRRFDQQVAEERKRARRMFVAALTHSKDHLGYPDEPAVRLASTHVEERRSIRDGQLAAAVQAAVERKAGAK